MPTHPSSQTAASTWATPDPTYCICREPTHPSARVLLMRWFEQSAHGDIVVGKDIPSHHFAKLLSHLMILELIDGDTDCHIRLAGTSLRRLFRREVSGERLSELYSASTLEQQLARLREVRRTGEPIILAATMARADAPPFAHDEVRWWNVIGIFVRDD